MATYSFMNVGAVLSSPGGLAIDLGYGAAAAEEGITIEYEGDKNTLTMGADGEGMHNLHAAKNGTITVRLLKTSPVNAQLNALYNTQSVNPALWGTNGIVVTDPNRGDITGCREVAFKRHTPLTYAKDGGMNEWRFDAIKIDPILGIGQPSVI